MTQALQGGSRANRLIAFYIVLTVATVTVAAVVVSAGRDEHAQPSIAGGYDLDAPNPCFGVLAPPPAGPPLPNTAPKQPPKGGPAFDVLQSGRFVNFTNAERNLHGKLELGEKEQIGGSHRLSGDVT